jgi:hypothetical protein
MAGLIFGGGRRTNAQTPPAATSLRIQTSNAGMALPLVYGRTRLAGNLVWYGDFAAIPHSSGGGGGGGGKGGGGGGGGVTSYSYSASVVFGLCEGPIGGVGTIWRDKEVIASDATQVVVVPTTVTESYAVPGSGRVIVSHAGAFLTDGGVKSNGTPLPLGNGQGDGSYAVSAGTYFLGAALAGLPVAITYGYGQPTQVPAAGLALFNGSLGQAPWGYLQTAHPEEALGYNQVAYLAGANYTLGDSPELPNHNFEVIGPFAGTAPGPLDADPADVIADYLTSPDHGAGLDPGRLGDLSVYRAYCRAAGLRVSPAYVEAEEARDALKRLALVTNSEFVWSSGRLTLVPYGDTALDANGASYSPPGQPLYDLDDDDFIADGTDDPVQLARKRPADQKNAVKFEFVNRASQYNVDVVEAKDEAMIALYGARPETPIKLHEICDPDVARASAQLWLQRQAVRNGYSFRLGWRYVLLDPMDIVTLTDASLGLDRQWVRILDIEEDDTGTLTVTAEDYLAGTGAAAAYGFETTGGPGLDTLAPPGNAVAPVFIEPPDGLTGGGLEVWIATAGGPRWGGADIWLSADGATYKSVGRITGPARMGVLAAALPAVSPAASGPTVDTADTLAVDLSPSNGQLISGTPADALALDTLCWVDGELIAYGTATLTGRNAYTLSYLVRGAYGTPIGAHGAGSAFVRLDRAPFKYPFDQARIGQPIYVKLLSFNLFGAARQGLAEVQPYTYVPRGTALASPLPDVENLVAVLVGGRTVLHWDPVADFRAVDYEVRVGPAWTTARVLPRTPVASYPAQGDGTYWVAAHARPLPGLEVYSLDPRAIVLAGAVLVRNVVASFEAAAAGWPGSLAGGAFLGADGLELQAAGDLLAAPDILSLADVLWYGGVSPGGRYDFPPGETVDVGRPVACEVSFGFTLRGRFIDDNILTVPDVLALADLLGAALGARVSARPQIGLSQDGSLFGDWQDWVPGQYLARAFRARLQLESGDPRVRAIVGTLGFTVDVPDRLDKGTAVAVPAGGLAVAYAAPFNAVPNVQVTILDAQAGDDALVTSTAMTGFTVALVNGATPVARTVNWIAQGY